MATTLPSILTLSEVAEWLRLSPEAVVAQCSAGRLVGHHEAEEWRFWRDDVEAWSERYDQRKILLRQVGVFADDPSLPLIQEEIDRRRRENTLDAAD
jgi:hypothetical protein